MNKKIIYYSFEAWIKGKESNFFDIYNIKLYAENLDDLIDKIKLFNKVACFECWTSMKFFKWELDFFDNENISTNIIDAYYFPEMINAHKIKVWGKTYEV